MSLPFKHLHFIGIAGIGMSGLARLCLSKGIRVQGSNIGPFSETLRLLQEDGIQLFLGHQQGYLSADVDAVIVSSAISLDNPELEEAKDLGLPILHRSSLLQEMLRPYKVIAVTGTHGKTTTTSLMGYVMEQAGLDPLILSGGIMGAYNSNIKMGLGSWAVVEADESDKSHLNFSSLWGAIATNIEAEHMHSYQSFTELVSTFSTFLKKAIHPVVCGDDPELAYMASMMPDVTTYGFHLACGLRAQNVRYRSTHMSFDVVQGTQFWSGAMLQLLGRHNVLNALAVIAMARFLEIPEPLIARALSQFPGVARRMTVTGKAAGVTFIDDYAHHPTEIKAVLETLKQISLGRVIAICQPHRYSRLQECMSLFQACFQEADHVILLPVYSAGEPPLEGITSAVLQKKIESSLLCEGGLEELVQLLHGLVAEGDTVVCLGAGTITELAHSLPFYFQETPCTQTISTL